MPPVTAWEAWSRRGGFLAVRRSNPRRGGRLRRCGTRAAGRSRIVPSTSRAVPPRRRPRVTCRISRRSSRRRARSVRRLPRRQAMREGRRVPPMSGGWGCTRRGGVTTTGERLRTRGVSEPMIRTLWLWLGRTRSGASVARPRRDRAPARAELTRAPSARAVPARVVAARPCGRGDLCPRTARPAASRERPGRDLPRRGSRAGLTGCRSTARWRRRPGSRRRSPAGLSLGGGR
jgi:hypothetical protein